MIFQQTERVNALQDEIRALQGRLKLLGRTTELSRTDRLRYFDIISEIDEYSVFLELIAGQIMGGIEQIGVSLDEATKSEIREFLAERNIAREAIYGACAKPITLPFLEETEVEAAP